MKPFFSIITPVYNRASLVGETIESVLSQTFTDFEYILVDDCSTDGSLKVIELYAAKDQRIKIIKHNVNQGRCIARNSGIDAANGEWICYLDSDDIYFNNHLKTLVDLIEQNPDLKAFATEQWHKKSIRKTGGVKYANKTIINFLDSIKGNPIQLNQLCYSYKYNIKFAYENIPISEDWLFIRELLLNTDIYKTHVVTNELIEHDNRSMNATNANSIAQWNLYTANLFITRNKLNEEIKNSILCNTYLLCSNIILSSNSKIEGYKYLKQSLVYKRFYLNNLFYKAVIKIIINLFR